MTALPSVAESEYENQPPVSSLQRPAIGPANADSSGASLWWRGGAGSLYKSPGSAASLNWCSAKTLAHPHRWCAEQGGHKKNLQKLKHTFFLKTTTKKNHHELRFLLLLPPTLGQLQRLPTHYKILHVFIYLLLFSSSSNWKEDPKDGLLFYT